MTSILGKSKLERGKMPQPYPPSICKIFAIANQKGGVGKTTTAINLSTALAAVGKRVLLFDIDPQGNASISVGINRDTNKCGSYEVLIDGAPISDALINSKIPNMKVVASTLDLSGAEVELARMERREYRLNEAFSEVVDDFDYVLIDCPPTLGLLTLNALVFANSVLIPLQCEYLALEGLSQLVGTIHRVQNGFNPQLEIQGIVLTMFDSRNKLSTLVANDVRTHFGNLVYHTIIPRNVRVSEAPSHGVPVLIYDFQCPGSQAYIHLAGEILRREEEPNS